MLQSPHFTAGQSLNRGEVTCGDNYVCLTTDGSSPRADSHEPGWIPGLERAGEAASRPQQRLCLLSQTQWFLPEMFGMSVMDSELYSYLNSFENQS